MLVKIERPIELFLITLKFQSITIFFLHLINTIFFFGAVFTDKYSN